jgi:hypothetical protein
MANYKVRTHIKHNGDVYEPGEIIELSKKEADAMPWAVEPAPQAQSSSSSSVTDLGKMTKAQLVEYGNNALGLKLDDSASKDELLAAIAAAKKA